ncbi:MAG: hypothetical protein AB8B69_12605 [Chitinophagales bacterium]
METLKNIHLHAVLQISPSDFDLPNYPFEDRNYSPERKYHYWKQVLTKNGLPNLEPMEKGFEYIKISDIDDESLETLVKLNLVDISEYRCSTEDLEAEMEEAESEDITPRCFDGGVVVTSQGKMVITPQCCYSLQDYKEWTRIKQSKNFELIWIGHPWMYYKTQGNDILFTRLIEKAFDGKTWKHYLHADNTMMMDSSNCIEKKHKEIDDRDLKYSVNFAKLKEAIGKMEMELHTFKKRIEAIAIKWELVNPSWIAACMVDGNGEMLSYGEEDVN